MSDFFRQPIVLFVDQQTTGGYSKIANVVSADASSQENRAIREIAVRFAETLVTNLLEGF